MKYLIFSLSFFISLNAYPQIPFDKASSEILETNGNSKLSLSTHYLISQAELNKINNIENISSSSLVRLALKFKIGCDNTLENPIFKNIYKIDSNFATAFVSISDLSLLEDIDCLLYADSGEIIAKTMANARDKTYVDEVHLGYSLTQSYTGPGVIVGIIDEGFYYNHDNFKDLNGNLRISRVWERNNQNGLPPIALGFDYGSEFVGENDIISKLFDTPNKSHGTHVAGIAAGTGNTSDLRGVAPESEIVLVSFFNRIQNSAVSDNTYVDAIEYLINYSESVNKPLVINMSFGRQIGPHDGTTVEEQLLDTKSDDSGLVLVAAAGNQADVNQHAYLDFTLNEVLFLRNSNNNVLRQNIFSSPGHPLDGLSQSTFDFWGEAGGVNSAFEVTFGVVNVVTAEEQSEIKSINVNGFFQDGYELLDNDEDNDQDSWGIIVMSEINPLNNRPHLTITVFTDNDDLADFLIFQVNGSNTKVHCWSEGNAPFENPSGFNFTEGDSYATINSPASATGVIAVGSYNSTSLNPSNVPIDENELSVFSSKGPRIDFVQKPNITAPGNAIISSVSSLDENYDQLSEIEVNFGNHSYAKMKGTSMASPVVAGIAALWLEANPNLSTNQVMTIMHDTAIIDSYTETGFLGPTPNYEWGYGKVDALAGLQQIENSLSIEDTINSIVKLYPNPTSGILNVDFRGAQVDEVVINNLLGQKILQENLNSDQISKIDLTIFEIGIYILSFKNKGQTVLTTKILKSE